MNLMFPQLPRLTPDPETVAGLFVFGTLLTGIVVGWLCR